MLPLSVTGIATSWSAPGPKCCVWLVHSSPGSQSDLSKVTTWWGRLPCSEGSLLLSVKVQMPCPGLPGLPDLAPCNLSASSLNVLYLLPFPSDVLGLRPTEDVYPSIWKGLCFCLPHWVCPEYSFQNWTQEVMTLGLDELVQRSWEKEWLKKKKSNVLVLEGAWDSEEIWVQGPDSAMFLGQMHDSSSFPNNTMGMSIMINS